MVMQCNAVQCKVMQCNKSRQQYGISKAMQQNILLHCDALCMYIKFEIHMPSYLNSVSGKPCTNFYSSGISSSTPGLDSLEAQRKESPPEPSGSMDGWIRSNQQNNRHVFCSQRSLCLWGTSNLMKKCIIFPAKRWPFGSI